jgi:hypothetical protein
MASFRAKIYKVGINLCVKVPASFTATMRAVKGYIPVRGTIDGHPFIQTLVPVKGEPYRLYVNGIMLKAAQKKNGQYAVFTLEQDDTPAEIAHPMPLFFQQKLKEYKLSEAFELLTPYRRKEIIRYLNFLKTAEAKERNAAKVIRMLREKKAGQ